MVAGEVGLVIEAISDQELGIDCLTAPIFGSILGMDIELDESVEDPVIAILEGAFGAPPPKDNPLALLFVICVSIASVAGFVCLTFYLAGYQASPTTKVACAFFGCIVAFFFGRSFGDRQGFNDKKDAAAPLGDGVLDGLKGMGGMMGGIGVGCVLVILQFLFGGLYSGIASLAGWNAPKIDFARAAVILRTIYNTPENVFPLQAIAAALEFRGLPTPRKVLFSLLRGLVEKDIIRGNPQVGFTGNPAKVNRLRK